MAAELFGTLTGAAPGKNSREIVAVLLNITGSNTTASNPTAINVTATNGAVNTTTVELCAGNGLSHCLASCECDDEASDSECEDLRKSCTSFCSSNLELSDTIALYTIYSSFGISTF